MIYPQGWTVVDEAIMLHLIASSLPSVGAWKPQQLAVHTRNNASRVCKGLSAAALQSVMTNR